MKFEPRQPRFWLIVAVAILGAAWLLHAHFAAEVSGMAAAMLLDPLTYAVVAATLFARRRWAHLGVTMLVAFALSIVLTAIYPAISGRTYAEYNLFGFMHTIALLYTVAFVCLAWLTFKPRRTAQTAEST